MSLDPESTRPTLDYASPNAQPSDFRGLWTIVLACFILDAVATAWWQVGIRIGQRVENQDVLFEPATGTDFWDNVVILPPCAMVTFGFIGVVIWCVIMIRRHRWGIGAALGLAIGFLALCATVCLNFPLIDEASP